MDDAFLIIAVGLSLRNSTLPSWLRLPLSQVNVGTTEGCVLTLQFALILCGHWSVAVFCFAEVWEEFG